MKMMDFLKQDVDRLLSYSTKQEVRIQDRWLGIANSTFQIIILLYIVFFVFIYDEGYLEYEHAKGVASASVSRVADVVVDSSGVPNTRSFSVEELTHPNLEAGNLFVATKIEIQQQKRGVCEDETRKCTDVTDCAEGVDAVCGENGFCQEPSWCAINPKSPAIETYKTPTAKLQLWVKAFVQFYNLNKERIFTNEMEKIIPYPNEFANAWSVEDLLLLCSPPVRYEEISELGAAVEVLIRFKSCPVNRKECTPEVTARRIDSVFDEHKIGFEFKHATPSSEVPNERRLYTMRGVRFYFRAVGTGEELSISSIIFKVSTGIALLALAPLLADILMLNCFIRSKKYEARKYEYSQDLGDYFAELEKLPQITEGDDADASDFQDEEDIAWRRRMEEED
ncbi:unnamed protein product [Amoebophrya sp. A25]|nr:unnamed protein product [Amoebophrya sp. A25]|eukprot:GSA25T00007483001.1